MIPLMKPLNSILCLALAMHCWAEDNTLPKQAIPTTGNPLVRLAVIAQNPEVSRQLNLGFQCCLLQYQEKARHHFKQALTADSSCLMAHVGMLMVHPSGTAPYKEHLNAINELVEQVPLTPVEEWYLSTFLQYVAGDVSGAALTFKERASIYKRDVMAACWDLILNHYTAEQGGDLISRANQLIAQYPDNALAYFCRALLDEYSTNPSEEALQAAQKAVSLLPGTPTAELLYAHLLRRSRHFKEALEHYQAARMSAHDDLGSIPEADAATYVTASLAEACACWQTGDKLNALKRCLALSKKAQTQDDGAGEGSILMHWEARTLPLRLLVLQPSAPSGPAINAAAKACNAPADSVLQHAQDCLVAALRTRTLADSDRISLATGTLSKAEFHYAQLLKHVEDTKQEGGIQLTCAKRAQYACLGAIYRARIALYKDSESIWKPHLDELLAIPEARFLPPVLPQFNEQQ